MNLNVGTIDRVLRLLVGLALIVAPLLNLFGLGANSIVVYGMVGVGAIITLTAVFGVCPIYSLFGIRT